MADFGYKVLETINDEAKIVGRSWDAEEARHMMYEASHSFVEHIPDSKVNKIDFDTVSVANVNDNIIAEYEVIEFEQR